MIDDVYVYCSDEKINEYLPAGVKFLMRPEILDTPQANGTEIIKCFIEEVVADVYVMSHATSPFVSVASIEKGIEAVTSGQYDSAFSVDKIQQHMWQDGKPVNFDPANIPRSQDLKAYYGETSGFYIFPRDLVIKHARRVGFNPCLIEMSKIENIDIDYEEDFLIADAILNSIIRDNK